jgi:AcrR family transcriptional regulator
MNDTLIAKSTVELRHKPLQARSTARLEQILAAARVVLAEDGRDRLTTARIAQVAGCSIGTLYRYFPDRVMILDAIAPDRDNPLNRLIPSTLALARDLTDPNFSLSCPPLAKRVIRELLAAL